jgi:hypothetical protein
MRIKTIRLVFLSVSTALAHSAEFNYQDFLRREQELQQRIDDLVEKTVELRRQVDTTHYRIECASKLMQVVVLAAIVFLGIGAIDYAFKRYKQRGRKIHEKNRCRDDTVLCVADESGGSREKGADI